MSFGSCRIAGAVPRLLWVRKFTVPPGMYNTVGRNPACGVVSTYLACKREFHPYVVYLCNDIALYCVVSDLMLYTSIICCMFCF